MTLDKADELVKKTDYYHLAAGTDENPINHGDAASFFIEGFDYAKKLCADAFCENCIQYCDGKRSCKRLCIEYKAIMKVGE